jgi:hypothetical protein
MTYEEALAWVEGGEAASAENVARALMGLIDREREDERSKVRQQAAQACLDSRVHGGPGASTLVEDNTREDCAALILRLPLV